MDYSDREDSVDEDILRREKLLELEKRQQALKRLCEEALKEDEEEKDLPPYLSPPSNGGGAHGATKFSRLPPPPVRDPVTDDLLTGEVQSFRDPNSLGRASSLNSASRAPSVPHSAFMPPRRSASRDQPWLGRPLSRPFVPRSTLRTAPAPQQQDSGNASVRRAWSAHAGINATPVRDNASRTPPEKDVMRRQASAYRNRYFGVVDTPANSTPSPYKKSFDSGARRTPPPPPPPPHQSRAELRSPLRDQSRTSGVSTYGSRLPPPPPPRAERVLYAPPSADEFSDPPVPPPPRSSKRQLRAPKISLPPPPPPEMSTTRVRGTTTRARSSPSGRSSAQAKAAAAHAPLSEASLSLAEAYSRYAPPSSYRNGGLKHFFKEALPSSSAASVAESSSFTSFFSSVSKVEQWRSQLQSNDDALGAKPAHAGRSKRGHNNTSERPQPPPPPTPLAPKAETTLPAPPAFSSGSESRDEAVSIWENESVPPYRPVNVAEPKAESVSDVESVGFLDNNGSATSEPVSVPPLPRQKVPRKKSVGTAPHPYATNAPPPIELRPVEPVLAAVQHDTSVPPQVQVSSPAQPKAVHDCFDETPEKVALRQLLTSGVSESQSQQQRLPYPAASHGQPTTAPPPLPHADGLPNGYTRSEHGLPQCATDANESVQLFQEKLQEAQIKTEALARHLVKAINEKTMLADNVKQLEELVEESTFEVGRLQRLVVEQQKDQSASAEILTVLRAKEREIGIYEEEIQRLNAAIDRHVLRVASNNGDNSIAKARADDVDAAMTEVGAAYLAQKEAEDRAAQLSSELETAVEQIQALDERLAEMERGQAANRASSIRDAIASQDSRHTVGDRPTGRASAGAETEHWPVEARRMIAQLTAHAEELLVQNSESARHASSVLQHANHSREELQQRLSSRCEEVEHLQEQCARLQREKSILMDVTGKMRDQLKEVKEDAQLVSELVRTSRDEAEQVIGSCTPLATQETENSPPRVGTPSALLVKDFAQQVMRDFHAVSRFLAALREMDIGHDSGYEILVKLADGASPSDKLYDLQRSSHLSPHGGTPSSGAQQRIQKRRDFVIQAVQQALVGANSPSTPTQPIMLPQPWADRKQAAEAGQDEITEADAFEAEKEVDLVSRVRVDSRRREPEPDTDNSIYRDDTGMVLSDVRRALSRAGSAKRHSQASEADIAPSPLVGRKNTLGGGTEVADPESQDEPRHGPTSPPVRVPFSVIEETPPSVSRSLRLSSGTPADRPHDGLMVAKQRGSADHIPTQNNSRRATLSCNSSEMLSVSDIPFDNVEAEKQRQRRSHEMSTDATAVAEETAHPSPPHTPVARDEEDTDVSPVIRPPTRRPEVKGGDGAANTVSVPSPNENDDNHRVREPLVVPESFTHDDIQPVDLLGDDFVLPSEQLENLPTQIEKPVDVRAAATKSPGLHSLPPLAPSSQGTPSQPPALAVSVESQPLVSAELPPSHEKEPAPARRRRFDDDDEEDNEPSLFFYAESESRTRVGGATGGDVEASHQQVPLVPGAASTDRTSLASSVDREGSGNVLHHYRAPPSDGVSASGAALPRLQRSATTSPRSSTLAPSASSAPTAPRATLPDHDSATQQAPLQEPHKSSPSKPSEPRHIPDTAAVPEELSGIEDDMGSAEDIAPHEVEEEEPVRRSGTARPSSTTHRLAYPGSADDEDEVEVATASPSPKAARGHGGAESDRDGDDRQRSTTAPGGATSGGGVGLPSMPASETPAGLADAVPLPAEPLAAPSKPESASFAARPRSAVATTDDGSVAGSAAPATLSVPRVNQDPPDTRLSLTRDTAAHPTGQLPKKKADKPVSAVDAAGGAEEASKTPTASPHTPHLVALSSTASSTGEDPSSKTDSPRVRRKEEVARILERIRLKREEEAAALKSAAEEGHSLAEEGS